MKPYTDDLKRRLTLSASRQDTIAEHREAIRELENKISELKKFEEREQQYLYSGYQDTIRSGDVFQYNGSLYQVVVIVGGEEVRCDTYEVTQITPK